MEIEKSITNLDDFLNLPDVDNIEQEVYVSKRLGKFKVKAMTSDEYAEYTKKSKGKMSAKNIQFDGAKFNLLIVAGQTIYPDFNNAELLKKANCLTGVDLVKKKLLAGEIADLANKICEISGFDTTLEEDIEEAKN